MDPGRWQHIKSIFEEVIELPADKRPIRLAQLCGDDAPLRSQVEALIAADASEEAMLDQTPGQLAEEVFERQVQPIPESIGPYHVIERIGFGGMGTVYKVHREGKAHAPLAVKVLRGDAYHSTLVQRFKIEWQVLASLNHPNIAKLYDSVLVDKGQPYFAMEYIDGLPITTYCNNNNLLLADRLALFSKVCSATHHAHENHIIHRDIKPANVLVNADGVPKLLDFGIAKVLNPDILDTTALMTQTGYRVLTPSYASPEQLRGETLSTSSDVYSLGVLLYEILTGHRPHNISGLSQREAERVICEKEPALMSEAVQNQNTILSTSPTHHKLTNHQSTKSKEELSRQLRGDLDIICQKALHKDPTRRYLSVEALQNDIERHLNNKPIFARPDDFIYKARKFVYRNKISVIAVAAVVSLLVIFGIFNRFTTNTTTDLSAGETASLDPKTLVALPFTHQGTDQQDYFVAGVVDEITSYLSKTSGLRVINQNSATRYKGENQSVGAVGAAFDADYILKGAIEFEDAEDPSGRVRVLPELVSVKDEKLLWSVTYNETISDIFTVQNVIALKVAEALNLTLMESDQLGQARHLTDNLEAYNYFLRGNAFFKNDEDASSLRLAETMYRQAIQEDSTFSKAFAELSKVHAAMWFQRVDRSDSRCNQAQEAAESALIHDPNEAASYEALGMHAYRCRNNLIQSQNYFEQALRIDPNTLDAIQGKAFVLRRQGKLQEALSFFEQLAVLDPLGADYTAVAHTNQLLRNYPQADSAFQLSLRYFPEEALVFAIYARMLLAWQTPEAARAALDAGSNSTQDNDFTRITSIYIDLVNKNYQEAINRVDAMGKEIFDTQVFYIPAAHLKARAYRGMGDFTTAQQHEQISLSHLIEYLKINPDDARAHATLGRVYAGLGNETNAIRSGLRALELMPIQKDAVQGPHRVEDMAAIYTLIGQQEEAVEQLQILLEHPGFVSAKLIGTDPTWDGLRASPAFQALMKAHL